MLPPQLSAATRAALDEHAQLYRLRPKPPGACIAVRAETLLASDFSADAALAALTAPRAVGAGTLGTPGAPGGGSTADDADADATPRVAALAPEAVPRLLGLPAGLQRCVGAACLALGRCGLLPLLGEPSEYRSMAEGAARLELGAAALCDLHVLSPSDHSLLGLLDHTATPPGARLLQRWLVAPLAKARPAAPCSPLQPPATPCSLLSTLWPECPPPSLSTPAHALRHLGASWRRHYTACTLHIPRGVGG